ncbi:unnamed protein product [Moneuplotes crassus]|uniref:C2H2-type domain-containing protein n=1 Tax=Euplotes crassus TaxID=5936 RepID=A0AAD1Y8R1_EUPCR|nr:unnamed protein product [Moneuplotes crassus]
MQVELITSKLEDKKATDNPPAAVLQTTESVIQSQGSYLYHTSVMKPTVFRPIPLNVMSQTLSLFGNHRTAFTKVESKPEILAPQPIIQNPSQVEIDALKSLSPEILFDMVPKLLELKKKEEERQEEALASDLASKAQVYENFLLLTKNDINLELLKDFEYKTKTRRTKSGKEQTVYICAKNGCNKEFLRTCNLLDHCRMHNGIKPNECSYCKKTFTQKSNLTKHLKVHQKPDLNDRKRYPCPRCSAAYTERYNLKKHFEKCHKGESFEQCMANNN